MSRQDRLKGYQNERGPKGEASSKANLRYWSDRAEANSYNGPGNGPLAKGDEECRREALADKNHVGGSFMPRVRRGA